MEAKEAALLLLWAADLEDSETMGQREEIEVIDPRVVLHLCSIKCQIKHKVHKVVVPHLAYLLLQVLVNS